MKFIDPLAPIVAALQAALLDLTVADMFQAIDFAADETLVDAIAVRVDDFARSSGLRDEKRAKLAQRWAVSYYVHRARVDSAARARVASVPDTIFDTLNGFAPVASDPAQNTLQITDGSVFEEGPLLRITMTFEYPLVVGSTG